MAKEIYKSGNYIITVDADNKSRLFPIGKTVYDEHNSVFRITEGVIEDDQLTISFSDSTNWVDDSAAAYTEATLRTFLRDNTGFRPASGGSGAAPIGADLMKTGQTISYGSGDDGDIEAGRETDFLTLASNNPFGNTNRFTDVLGTQIYRDKIFIDWSTYNGTTVLGYGDSAFSVNIWDDCIDEALATSIGSFTSGWRLPNINEAWNIINMSVTNNQPFSYSPFSRSVFLINQYDFWTSTHTSYSSGSAYWIDGFRYREIRYSNKSNAKNYFPVRNFTVTGTTLT